ncbi:MAG: hypothetical protein KJZ78_14620, partial [Bryobacteraceae bacterium]|nr:hypothetical protein [Bryobacteraceae bacterium]
MKLSRRSLFAVGLGSALTACSGPKEAETTETSTGNKLALEEFQPKSMLVTPQNPKPRAKYPV